MASFNKVIVMGNLVKDPERTDIQELVITKARLALNKAWIDNKGDKQTATTYIDLKAFGKNAENIAKYFTKGKNIFVEGHLETDEWIDKKTSERKSRVYVVVDSFQFTGSPPQSGVSNPPSVARTVVPAPQVAFGEYDEIDSSEVPF
jgi:single-strand DNA-binding protein